MRFLPAPIHEDSRHLEEMARDLALSSFPLLQQQLIRIRDAYDTYCAANGDATRIEPLGLDQALGSALRAHYSGPLARFLPLFENTRRSLSPGVCPMCGSMRPDTLDHFLPKAIFPEYAVFSKNLVPACDCNSSSRPCCDNDQRLRVLHPYFDQALTRRLAYVSISGSIKRPRFTLVPYVRERPLADHVRFHLENVVRNERIKPYLIDTWARMRALPLSVITTAKAEDLQDSSRLTAALKDLLSRTDGYFMTPNNWFSMFLFGVLRRRRLIIDLANDFSDLLSDLRNPDD